MSDSRPDPGAPAPASPAPSLWRQTRRGFLWGFGLTGTALALGIPLGLPALRKKIHQRMSAGEMPPGPALSPRAWIEVLPTERVRVLLPKAEMGQGSHTGLAQLVAEELEVLLGALDVHHASTHEGEPSYRGTFGSMSISTLYTPMRTAAATLREMLRLEAARRLGVPAGQLTARAGGFDLTGETAKRLSYGQLVGAAADWKVPDHVPLKRRETFTVIGRPLPRLEGRAKVTGAAIYGADARVPDMLHGAVLRRPTFEAKARSVSAGKAASMPGVVKVVIEEDFAGVVARTREQAAEARDALEASWDLGHPWQQQELVDLVVARGPHGATLQQDGDAAGELARSSTLTAEYRTALVGHATMETQSALADVQGTSVKVQASTQHEAFVARQVASALGLEPANVEVTPLLVGGGFGRKVGDDNVSSAAVEAARLSRAVGKPVHVSWTRADEIRCGYVRPMTHHRFQARVAGGKLEALHWEQASGDSLLGLAPAQDVIGAVVGFDPGALRGAWIPYAVPHREVTGWRRRMPLPTGQWRGLGLAPNTYALETFLDEVAHAAGVDPLKFRLDHLPPGADGARMKAVLEAVAEKAQWGSPPPPGRARGLACAFAHGTLVAEVAEISLDAATGRILVPRVVVALDCGLAVNPNLVIGQVEGCVVMGTSGALLEELTVKDGAIAASNFDSAPILRMADAPEVETIIVSPPGGVPSGVGEPPLAPVAPAIANALFALTGKRLRELPMSPERVKRALAG